MKQKPQIKPQQTPSRLRNLNILLLCALLAGGGCATYSQKGYELASRVTIVDSPGAVTGVTKHRATVKRTWRYGHVAWYHCCALGNVALTRITCHVDFDIEKAAQTTSGDNLLKIRQTEKPIGVRSSPEKGLFILKEGDEVIIGMTQFGRRVLVTIYPLAAH